MQGARLTMHFDAAGLLLLILSTLAVCTALGTLLVDLTQESLPVKPPTHSSGGPRPQQTVRRRALRQERCGTLSIEPFVTGTRSQGTQGVDNHHSPLQNLVGHQRLLEFKRAGGRFTT